MTITQEMPTGDVVRKNPQIVVVPLRYRLMCFGCAVARFENMELGALAHSINVEALIKDLNAIVPQAD